MHSPVDTPWRSHKALALHGLGRAEDALVAAHDDLELSRQWGAAGSVARALRVLGIVDPEAGIEHLRAAVEAAAGSPARLEHAKALAELGLRLRRAGLGREARAPLREAIDLARRCGATGLVNRARSELHAAGPLSVHRAQRRRSAQASERRIATLAADRRSNREIAQELFITPKTGEMHLSNVYRKLEISSRRELAATLGGALRRVFPAVAASG